MSMVCVESIMWRYIVRSLRSVEEDWGVPLEGVWRRREPGGNVTGVEHQVAWERRVFVISWKEMKAIRVLGLSLGSSRPPWLGWFSSGSPSVRLIQVWLPCMRESMLPAFSPSLISKRSLEDQEVWPR